MSMLFKRIKDWATSITAFRTGDVIPVDGPSGTAKMSKDNLLKETAEKADEVNGYKVEALKNATNATSTTCTSDASGHKCFVYPMLAGCRYRITAGTANIGIIYLCSKLSTSSADRIEKLSDGVSAYRTIIVTPSNSNNFVSFYFASAGGVTIEAISASVDTYKGLTALQGKTETFSKESSGWNINSFALVSNKKYTITCNVPAGVTTICSLDNPINTSSGHRIETFANSLAYGASLTFTPLQDSPFLAIYYVGAGDLTIVEEGTIASVEAGLSKCNDRLSSIENSLLSHKGTVTPPEYVSPFSVYGIEGLSFEKGRTYTIGFQVTQQVTNGNYVTVKIARNDNTTYQQIGAFMSYDFATLDTGRFYGFTFTATEDIVNMKVGSYFNNTTFNGASFIYYVNDVTDVVDALTNVGDNASNAGQFYPKFYSNEIAQLKAGSDKVFVLVSDLHKAATNFQRVCDVAKAIGADAILNGGDFVNSLGTESLSWFNDIVNAQTIPVLSILGNHEGWSSTNPLVWQDAEDNYNLLMPTVVSQADVVQPPDASTLFKCYYYKDFGNIRIICIDGIDYNMTNAHHWDATQLSWFQSVLADAITNSKKVIVFNHYPYDKTMVTQKTEAWNSWDTYLNNYRLFDDLYTPASAVAAVKDFIDNGGVFVGWLTGHMHRDLSVTINDDVRQYMMTTASGSYAKHTDSASFSDISERQYDCFTLVGVDTTHGFIKFLRCGLDEDSTLAKRKPYTWDYINRRFFKSN